MAPVIQFALVYLMHGYSHHLYQLVGPLLEKVQK